MIRKRQRPMTKEVLERLIEVGQNTNLSYKEIMALVPVTKSQLTRAVNAGKIPRRVSDTQLRVIEVGQDPTLTYEEIIERTGATYAQIQSAVYAKKIPRRSREDNNKKKMIEVAQDPNLSYEEIMDRVPGITYCQISWATKKGQIPKRSFDPEKLYNYRSNGGLRSAMVRWGYIDDNV